MLLSWSIYLQHSAVYMIYSTCLHLHFGLKDLQFVLLSWTKHFCLNVHFSYTDLKLESHKSHWFREAGFDRLPSACKKGSSRASCGYAWEVRHRNRPQKEPENGKEEIAFDNTDTYENTDNFPEKAAWLPLSLLLFIFCWW